MRAIALTFGLLLSAAAPPPWWMKTCGDARPFMVGSGITPPILVKRVAPVLPKVARTMHLSGTVIVETVINSSGIVCAARPIRTNRMPMDMVTAAVDAVKQWRFRPATKNRRPVAVVYNISVAYKV